jgi:hypothetical protein
MTSSGRRIRRQDAVRLPALEIDAEGAQLAPDVGEVGEDRLGYGSVFGVNAQLAHRRDAPREGFAFEQELERLDPPTRVGDVAAPGIEAVTGNQVARQIRRALSSSARPRAPDARCPGRWRRRAALSRVSCVSIPGNAFKTS